MRTHRVQSAAAKLLLSTFALAGCGGGLDVKRVNSAQDKPNNVWVFFNVKDGKEGVGNLKAEDFTIYEDGRGVSKDESKQEILNPEVAAVMYTMLLMDMSGSVSASGEADKLVDAAKAFSDRVGKSQKVGVYVFDGSPKITTVTPFTEAKGSVEGGIERLKTWKPQDPSTNLHGAIVEGVRELKIQLDRDPKPLKFGTLVVFTDGTDQAHRVSRDDMMKEIRDDKYENYEFYTIGVGSELDKDELKDIGKNGMELASDQTKIQQSFDKIAERIESATKSYYLLSYCTPSRAGEHDVRIKATMKKDKDSKSGDLEYRFTAEGFGPPPDCDPKRNPNFELKPADAPKEGTKPSAGAGAGVDVKASAGAGTK